MVAAPERPTTPLWSVALVALAALLVVLWVVKAVVGFVPEFSRNHLQHLIKAGWVMVDGVAVTGPAS